jgi:hypothetical protein
MKKLFVALLVLAFAFSGSYYYGKQQMLLGGAIVSFQPTVYPSMDRPFVVVVVGYNNGAFLEKTLRSI